MTLHKFADCLLKGKRINPDLGNRAGKIIFDISLTLAKRKIGDPRISEDIAQKSYERFHNRVKKGRLKTNSFTGYVNTIAYNLVRDRIRKAKNSPTYLFDSDNEHIPEDPIHLRPLEHRLELLDLIEAATTLSENYFNVLNAIVDDHKTQREMAHELFLKYQRFEDRIDQSIIC